ncbi:3-hydroxyacyl-CoA dehydrogenase PaaH [Mangrovitalea sediminis]|uniref:3-hydroxyacyl-CoA dehydrogenase PaaH n=1 Tax=Mangrovitalea sediminis TaxID=1982043 RepID=UPI003872C356
MHEMTAGDALSRQAVVAVVGAGTMGAGIAQVAAQYGHEVLLFDQQRETVEKALAATAAGLEKLVGRGKLAADERDRILQRLRPAQSLSDLSPATLVIEAIVERLDVKQALFRELESLCGPDTLLATNTSSISVTAIASALDHPQRLVGMHFFNPAPIMKLVEVVKGLDTSEAVAACIHATASAWGKQPVFTRSTPGFIVNRVARPFYAEGLRAIEEGATDLATLDAVMREAGGFRMGPFELMDLIGHDVNYAVTRSVFDAYYGDTRFQPSLLQLELVNGNRLGRKNGRGFYDYREGAETPQPKTEPACDRPGTIVVEGSLGVASPLIARWRAAGVNVVERAGAGLIRIGSLALALTDGRLAAERSVTQGTPRLALFDLALDYANCRRLAVTYSPMTDEASRQAVTGLFQAAGIEVSVIEDHPGLLVMRTVCMLANEAADAVHQDVCSAADADSAMRFGVNYPAGPLEWATRLGVEAVFRCLRHLEDAYGEDRYRPSLLLRKTVFSGGTLDV